MSETIQAGSSVLINYTLAIEDGTVVESTEGTDPLRFSLGDGTLIEGLEAVLLDMKVGDRQCLQLEAVEAFGFADETNVHMLTRDKFPEDMPLEKDLIVGFTTPSGEEVPGRIMEMPDDDLVVVDFNHPLAGHAVTFDVEVMAIGAEEETH
ncbi:MAG: FKBP-type peptidyl-prolyl cis-trans isomerase [Sulfuriflexus sp.]|nr:FKBP-type peptidyl-prolyl cis-trans isomerase [Sulfuriflexus sp.]